MTEISTFGFIEPFGHLYLVCGGAPPPPPASARSSLAPMVCGNDLLSGPFELAPTTTRRQRPDSEPPDPEPPSHEPPAPTICLILTSNETAR
jgi:hypothetical protein